MHLTIVFVLSPVFLLFPIVTKFIESVTEYARKDIKCYLISFSFLSLIQRSLSTELFSFHECADFFGVSVVEVQL